MLQMKFVAARMAQMYDIEVPKGTVVNVVDQGSLRPEGQLIMNFKRRVVE
jgi:hypothetical protein